MKNILTALLLSITILSFGQTTMNIYQSNGTTVNLPVSTIDSVNFTTTPPPSRMNIYQMGGGIISIVIANIDSITYTVQGTSGLAVLSTSPVTNINSTSAVSGGNVASDGGSPITQRGVVWSTSPSPTTANNSTTNGSGTGSFTSNLTNLTANTTYYVRAYATNSAGTAYGNEVSFTTTAGGSGTVHCTGTPTAVVDVTNPSTGKTWMDRNLGASQAATSSTDANSYGDLYQWGRGADGHQCRTSPTTYSLSSTDQPGHGDFIKAPNAPYDWRSPGNDNLWQGVNGVNNPCPSGYRLPTNTELNEELLSWSTINSAGAFASPLRLPMAGFSNGSLSNVGSWGRYWSSTVSSTDSRDLFFFTQGGSSGAFMDISSRQRGYSVRCLKDYTLATISTLPIGSITGTTATSGGNITNNGGAPVTQKGIVWSTSPNPSTANSSTSDGSGTGTYSSNLSGLIGNTTYYVRAYATNSAGTAYGNQVSFTTTAWVYANGTVHCTGTPTAIVDVTNPTTGKTWMDRNLGASQAAISSTDANSYGDLYQWGRRADGHQCRTSATTATLSSTDQPGHGDFITINSGNYDWHSPGNDNLWQGVNGVNNPCPSGYRLPTETELNAERLSWSTNNSAGAFASPLRLPVAGGRVVSNGSLNSVGAYGVYWSSTVSSTDSRALNFSSSNADMNDNYRASGLSVRCLKD